jgi:hypothetical protein
MNAYDIQVYDLLSRAGVSGARQLQDFIDNQVMQKYNELDIPGFTFAQDMQLDFTYEQVQGEYGLNIMASYVDLDSPATPNAKKGATINRGRIPRMKKAEYYNEDKIRKMLILEERKGANSAELRAAAIADLFVSTDNLIGGHVNSLSYQRHQIVSTGKFTLTAENNPDGLKNLTFASHVPTANTVTLSGTKRWWTDADKAVEGSAADPIADMIAMVETARKYGVRGHFEVNYNYLTQILKHSKVVATIGINALPAADATAQTAFAGLFSRDRKKAALEEIVGARIVEIDHMVATQKVTKGVVENIVTDSFAADVVVFVPDGNLGEIITVEPIAIAGGTYAKFLGGRGLMTVEADYTKKVQKFGTEMTSLAVPSLPQYFFYLKPNA